MEPVRRDKYGKCYESITSRQREGKKEYLNY
jgi:hypothetical protein